MKRFIFPILLLPLFLISPVLAEPQPSPSPTPTRTSLPPFDLKIKPVAPADNTRVINSRMEEFKNSTPATIESRRKNCGPEIKIPDLSPDDRDAAYTFDQASLGVCYATSASILVDTYRRNVLQSKSAYSTSPIGLALMTNASVIQGIAKRGFLDPGYNVSSGDPCYTINYLRQHYRTIESTLPIQKKLTDLKSERERDQSCVSFGKLGEFYKECKKGNYTVSQAADSCTSRLSKAGSRKPLDQSIDVTLIEMIRAGAAEDGFSSVVWNAYATEKDLSFSERVDLLREFQSLPQCVMYDSTSDLTTIIDKHLNASTALPSILALDAQVIQKEQSGPHAVTVIGRRFNEKKIQCEYLIRNSWGKNPQIKIAWDTEKNGDLWIDRTTLVQNVRNVYVLEDKEPKTGKNLSPSIRKP